MNSENAEKQRSVIRAYVSDLAEVLEAILISTDADELKHMINNVHIISLAIESATSRLAIITRAET